MSFNVEVSPTAVSYDPHQTYTLSWQGLTEPFQAVVMVMMDPAATSLSSPDGSSSTSSSVSSFTSGHSASAASSTPPTNSQNQRKRKFKIPEREGSDSVSSISLMVPCGDFHTSTQCLPPGVTSSSGSLTILGADLSTLLPGAYTFNFVNVDLAQTITETATTVSFANTVYSTSPTPTPSTSTASPKGGETTIPAIATSAATTGSVAATSLKPSSSATSTAVSSSGSSGGGGLSTGAIVGIVVGVVGGVALLILGLWMLLRRRKRSAEPLGKPAWAAGGPGTPTIAMEKGRGGATMNHEMESLNSPADDAPPAGHETPAASYAEHSTSRQSYHDGLTSDAPPTHLEHMYEEGMTADDIARLAEEERRIDAAIAEAEHRG